MPEVVNVVASGSLGRELKLDAVGDDIDAAEVKFQTGEYETPTAYIREKENLPLVTVYESGSYHISGAKSVEEAEDASQWFVSELERLGVENLNVSFAIRNVVIVGDLERTLDLNTLAIEFGIENIEYEPEQFPGLVYRPEEFDCVFLIFSSGRVVIPGSASVSDGFDAFEALKEMLE